MNNNDVFAETAMTYKRRTAGSFMLVEPAKIGTKLGGNDFCATRKIDGIMQCVFLRDNHAFMVGTGGTRWDELPCLDDFVRQLASHEIISATVVCELYVPRDGGRPRCHDVLAALGENGDSTTLRLAPFDLLELDGTPWKPAHYRETHRELCRLFDSDFVRPVEMKNAHSTGEIETIFEDWVESEGAEGLVVHSELPIVWKIKPRHTIDSVVVAYTIGENGVRDLLFAVRREDGLYQIFGAASNGLSDEQRSELLCELENGAVESDYIETDSRGAAFQFVRPRMVFELSINELMSESNAGRIKRNPLLHFSENEWKSQGMTPGVACLGLAVVRRRDDKTPEISSVRISQLTDLCPFAEETKLRNLPISTVLKRRVFRKISAGKTMLQKFVVWKTNKESSGEYPAYVLFMTDYSSGRRDFLKRDLRVANTEARIMLLMDTLILENIKKGWEELL